MKFLFNYLLAICAVTGISQPSVKKTFMLNGTLHGKEGEWIYLSFPLADGKYIRDGALVTDGRFSFKAVINEPTRAYLMIKPAKTEPNNSVLIFIEPATMTIALEPGRFDKAVVT